MGAILSEIGKPASPITPIGTTMEKVGHHEIHKDELEKLRGVFVDGRTQYMRIERENKYVGQIEWQADYFAAALRMPQDEIKQLHDEIMDATGLNERFARPTDCYRDMGTASTYNLLREWADLFKVSEQSLSKRIRRFMVGIMASPI